MKKIIIFLILAFSFFSATSQFGKDTSSALYMRNKQLFDSIYSSRLITFRQPGTDSIFALNVKPNGDSMKIFRFTITLPPVINNNPGRVIGTPFTVDTARASFVSYSDSLSVTNPLLTGSSSADLYLEFSTDGGTTWTQLAQNGNLSRVGVTVSAQYTNIQKGSLTAYVQKKWMLRIRSALTGTSSATLLSQQETKL